MSSKKSAAFACELCGVKVWTEGDLNVHCRGKGHQVQLDRKMATDKQVYVRGFPKSQQVTSDILSKLFGMHGNVVNAFVSQSKTDTYAIVTFDRVESASAALQQPTLLDGKLLVVKPRQFKPPVRGQRSNEELQENGPILPIDGDHLEIIKQAKDIDDQLLLLSKYGSLSQETSARHLALCEDVFSYLKLTFPSSIIVPFGSLITGLGTTTSDCDVCVLTSPSSLIRTMLSIENYFPEHLRQLAHSMSCFSSTDEQSNASTTPLPPYAPNLMDSERDVTTFVPPFSPSSLDSDHNTSCSSAASTPEPSTEPTSEVTQFKKVETMIKSLPNVERVYAIRSARCPIIRFYHTPTKLHVDLSVNNCPGPLNSRLMRAYAEFDSRVVPVIRAARLWMRWALKRNVNSYAVSLMVIYSLQRTTPPVLPCLQDIGAWPRNMEWFKLSSISNKDSVTIGPWLFKFEPIGALLPSTNTATVGDLLLHFFTFFVTNFRYGQEVVAIHCPSDKHLSPVEARQLYDVTCTRSLQSSSPLIVQDPFELSHNICKSVGKAHFSDLIRKMTQAMHQLTLELSSSRGQLLTLFTQAEPAFPATIKPRYISIDVELLARVLLKVDDFKALAPLLCQLDMTDTHVAQSLCRVVSYVLVSLLTQEFKFQCDLVPADLNSTLPNPQSMDTELNTDLESEDNGLQVATGSTQTVARKRQRASLDLDTDGPTDTLDEGTKRSKVNEAGSSPLDVLEQVLKCVPEATSHMCTATENTWCGRRVKRRNKETMESVDMLSALPATCLLQVSVSVVCASDPRVCEANAQDTSCLVVIIQPTQDSMKTNCDLWFALFKKFLLS